MTEELQYKEHILLQFFCFFLLNFSCLEATLGWNSQPCQGVDQLRPIQLSTLTLNCIAAVREKQFSKIPCPVIEYGACCVRYIRTQETVQYTRRNGNNVYFFLPLPRSIPTTIFHSIHFLFFCKINHEVTSRVDFLIKTLASVRNASLTGFLCGPWLRLQDGRAYILVLRYEREKEEKQMKNRAREIEQVKWHQQHQEQQQQQHPHHQCSRTSTWKFAWGS